MHFLKVCHLHQTPMTVKSDLSTNTRAALLLCGRFGSPFMSEKPLTQSEFHKLDAVMEKVGRTPGNLFEMTSSAVTALVGGQTEMSVRITALLARTAALEEAYEAWSKVGIWVLGERDKGYPSRLRVRLKSGRPPLLFGAGRTEYLDQGGVCIVGSRDSPKPALLFASRLADKCVSENIMVISSDMRGVDRKAVSTVLEKSGRVVVVMSDRLEKVVVSKRYRHALREGLLTMVTPFSPNASFSVANAIRVNRYQYALSDVAVVVETRRKGGIWSGAEENRNEGWVPAFVRSDQVMSSGNSALLHLGLSSLTLQDINNLDSIGAFFTSHAINHYSGASKAVSDVSQTRMPLNLYSIFLSEFQTFSASVPLNLIHIVKHFGIEPNQAQIWLQQAENEGQLKKIESKDSETTWISDTNGPV